MLTLHTSLNGGVDCHERYAIPGLQTLADLTKQRRREATFLMRLIRGDVQYVDEMDAPVHRSERRRTVEPYRRTRFKSACSRGATESDDHVTG